MSAPLLALLLLALAPSEPEARPGAFVLGIDGVDPVILQRLMDEGRMPHFQRLAQEGSFQELGTSNPPQSPVAWSNFVTGMNPGGHGIYDFIHRDPATYGPMSSAVPPLEHSDPLTISLFGVLMPLSGGDEIVNNRSGTPFWDHLHGAGVDVEVYRMPGNFPPTPSEARTLAGMGTDDLRAQNGKYSWFTDKLVSSEGKKAEFTLVTGDDDDDDGYEETFRTRLLGPVDAMNADDPTGSTEAPLKLVRTRDGQAWITVGKSQCIVREGEWSEWVEVVFDMLPGGMLPLSGIVRFYPRELNPGLELYVSPVNFNPAAPATAITTPDDFATELYDELGWFYTQGMPEETNALKDGFFDNLDFVKQVTQVHEDGHAMLDMALERFEPGDMSFVYLSDIDLQCHMLWHLDDPKTPDAPTHPAFKPDEPGVGEPFLVEFYEGIDKVLGDVRQRLPEDTLLIVMSDHGFQPFTRKVNLNDWLVQEGYLVLTEDPGTGKARTSGSLGLVRDPDTGAVDWTKTAIDWRKTKAYGLGFNGLYLNRQGREAEGIVSDAEADALIDEIMGKLEALRDGDVQPVRRAFRGTDVYTGSRVAEAPDIVVGYDKGYCASETTTLGEVTGKPVFYDNTGADFTGNHLMDPAVVPGILLVNRKLSRDGHDLTDVTAALLDHFGVPQDADMVGASFLD